MQGKVVVMTGGTSGIGEIAALDLATRGARVLLVARSLKRAEATLARLRQAGPKAAHAAHLADISRLAEMRRVAREIAAAEPRIDVLVNNAGAMFNRRIETPDGLEMTFALNHMAYFVLTAGLRPSLVAAAPSRIVNTASAAHLGNHLDFDDLQSRRNYGGYRTYGRSKLCNILFTRALARRLSGTGVIANCLHPGFVATRFGDESGGILGALFPFFKRFAISPEKGARTIVYLASAPEAAQFNGLYFSKSRPSAPSSAAQDDAAAERLWTESARIAGMAD